MHIIGSLQIGGAEKQVVTLLKELDKRKYNITLCCLRDGGPLERELENENVDIVFLRMRLRYFFVTFYKLVLLIKRKHIQIIHTHLYQCGIWGRIAAVITSVPIIITTEHGKTLWKKKRQILFERFVNKFTDLRIAVSEDIRQIRISKEKTPPDKILVIPNGVEVDDFKSSDEIIKKKRKELSIDKNTYVIGTVARLTPAKAQNYFLESFIKIKEVAPEVKYLIVGDGPLREQLYNFALRLNISEDVIFLGSRSDIAELLGVMDIFVLSSIREGVPVSLLEAMAAKRPVVATRVGGVPEVIEDGVSGILVPPEDSVKLAEEIINLLKNEKRRKEIGKAGYRRVIEKFSINSIARRIENVYGQLLCEKGWM